MNIAFGVDNLSESAFINASGKVVKISSESLQDRPPGTTFSALIAVLIQLRKMLAFSETLFASNFTCDFHNRILIP